MHALTAESEKAMCLRVDTKLATCHVYRWVVTLIMCRVHVHMGSNSRNLNSKKNEGKGVCIALCYGANDQQSLN